MEGARDVTHDIATTKRNMTLTSFDVVSTRAFTALYIYFSRHARAGNSVVSGRMWLKFELILAFMNVLVKFLQEL